MTRIRGIFLYFAGLMACGLVGGCYSADQVRDFLSKPHALTSATEYRVYPPDVLSISSVKITEIGGMAQRVRPDGMINLPLVGLIQVAGLTPKEIEAAVAKEAGKTYENAKCTVVVVGYNSQRYFIFGQVARPGPMPWTGRDSVLDALAMAQPNNLAWHERIVLVRGDKPQVGGYAPGSSTYYSVYGEHPEDKARPRHKLKLNLMAMIESGDMANNVLLMPNDVIYVQASPLAKIGLALQRLLFPINPAIQAVGVPANFENASDRDYNRRNR